LLSCLSLPHRWTRPPRCNPNQASRYSIFAIFLRASYGWVNRCWLWAV